MRPLYVDINGTTDASGNATIPVALPRMTGRWHNAKFSLSLSGSAEWAILVNGRPYTYGRGRRVTLGPELIQDGQTATVSVIGGPTNATVDGTATGVSGDPAEIMAAYTPSPNTIALDTANQRLQLYPDGTPASSRGVAPTFPSFTVGSNGTASKTITILPTQTNLRIMVVGSTQFRLQVAGHETGEGYLTSVLVDGSSNFSTANSPFRPIDIRVEPSWDTQVDITITDQSSTASSVYVSALFGTETTVLAGATTQLPVFSISTTPPLPWQAANAVAAISSLVNNGATLSVVAGVAGQTIRLHSYAMSSQVGKALVQLQDSSGRVVTDATNAGFFGAPGSGTGPGALGGPVDFKGAPLVAAALGAQIVNNTGAQIDCRGHLSYNQAA